MSPKGAPSIQTVPPSKLLHGAKRHIQGINSHPDDLKLLGSTFTAVVSDRIVDPGITLSRAIDVSSTLTIPLDDPDGELWRHKILLSPFSVELDGLSFTFVAAAPQGDTLTLTMESTPAWRMRQVLGGPDNPHKVLRSKMTRAEFFASLVAEFKGPKIPLYCPELHTIQPIKNERQQADDELDSNLRRDRGLGDTNDSETGKIGTDAKLTVKGIPANAEQLQNGATCLQVGASLKAPLNAMLAVIMAGTQENNMTNSDQGSGCLNYFCFISQTAANFSGDYKDLADTAHSFFTDGFGAGKGAIAMANEGMSPGDICANIENPKAEYRGLYAQWEDQAREWVAAFNGGSLEGLSGGTATVTETKQYAFQVENNESYWDAGLRLGDEVNWRRFEAAGIVYFIAETDLLKSKRRMRVTRETEGVISVSPTYNSGKPVTEVSLEVLAKDWAAPPGTVVLLRNEGPATGRYLVSEIETVLGVDDATITLKRPTKPLPEPAPETTTSTIDLGASGGRSSGGNLASLTVDTSPGDPHWGGAADLHRAIIKPIADKHGMTAGGTKEPNHTPGGDHDPAETTAYATDWTGGDMASFAEEVAAVLGDASVVHTYNSITAECANATFVCQVLYDLTNPEPGPGDYAHTGHVHTGAHLA